MARYDGGTLSRIHLLPEQMHRVYQMLHERGYRRRLSYNPSEGMPPEKAACLYRILGEDESVAFLNVEVPGMKLTPDQNPDEAAYELAVNALNAHLQEYPWSGFQHGGTWYFRIVYLGEPWRSILEKERAIEIAGNASKLKRAGVLPPDYHVSGYSTLFYRVNPDKIPADRLPEHAEESSGRASVPDTGYSTGIPRSPRTKPAAMPDVGYSTGTPSLFEDRLEIPVLDDTGEGLDMTAVVSDFRDALESATRKQAITYGHRGSSVVLSAGTRDERRFDAAMALLKELYESMDRKRAGFS